MTDRVVGAHQMIDWLVANGLVEEREAPISRILIDIKFGDVVKVYIERFGTEKMLEVVPPTLAPSQIREVDRTAVSPAPAEPTDGSNWPQPHTDGDA